MNDVICYTSKDGSTIKNINIEWANKIIMYSPTIVQGLDFQPPIFQPVFVNFKGAFTINPLQVSQQICRNRNISAVFIFCGEMPNEEPFKDIHETREHIMDTINSIKSFNKYSFNTTITLTNKNYSENEYSSLYYEYIYQQQILSSCCTHNLCCILALKGFEIVKPTISICPMEIQTGKVERLQMKLAIKKSNSILYQKYVDNTLEEPDEKYKTSIDNILKYYSVPLDTSSMDEDTLQIHKNFLIDNEDNLSNPRSINYYYAISLLLGQNPQRIENAIKKRLKEDFMETIHTATCIKVKEYLNIISKYLSDVINPLAFSYNTGDKRLLKPISLTDDEFSYIKRFSRTKKPKPTTQLELLPLFQLIVYDIFGNVLTKERSKSKVDKNLTKEQKAEAKVANKDKAIRDNISSIVWDTEHIEKFVVLLNYTNAKNECDYTPIILADIVKKTEPQPHEDKIKQPQILLERMHKFLWIT